MFRLSLAALGATIALATTSVAQGFPQRPITLIVPFPAGGPADGLARAFAEGLGQELAQSIVVDNRPGGGTMVGLSAAARAEPDGYTLVLGVSATTIQPTINPSLGFDPTTDLTAITLLVEPHMAFLVNTESGMETVGDLIERARAEPGTVTYASTGHGAATHITSLIAMGLVSRKVDPNDRRKYVISLTERGRALEEPALQAAIDANVAALAGVSERERDLCLNILRLAHQNLMAKENRKPEIDEDLGA